MSVLPDPHVDDALMSSESLLAPPRHPPLAAIPNPLSLSPSQHLPSYRHLDLFVNSVVDQKSPHQNAGVARGCLL